MSKSIELEYAVQLAEVCDFLKSNGYSGGFKPVEDNEHYISTFKNSNGVIDKEFNEPIKCKVEFSSNHCIEGINIYITTDDKVILIIMYEYFCSEYVELDSINQLVTKIKNVIS